MFPKYPYARPLILNSPMVTATFSYKRKTNRLQWGLQCNGRHPKPELKELATSEMIYRSSCMHIKPSVQELSQGAFAEIPAWDMGWFFHSEHSHFGTIPSPFERHTQEGIAPRGIATHPPLCVSLETKFATTHTRYNTKQWSILPWKSGSWKAKRGWNTTCIEQKQSWIDRSMLCFPNVVVLSSLSFLPMTQPPIRRPNYGPPIGFSGSRVTGWTIFSLEWMNVEHNEGAMRNGPEMLIVPCLGIIGRMKT